MSKKILNSEKGFTLVEIIVAMAISTIVLLATIEMFDMSNKLIRKGDERSNHQMNIRTAATEVTKDIRYAKELEVLEDTDIPTGPADTTRLTDTEYKYIYFNNNKQGLTLLEYKGTLGWTEKIYLDEIINTDKEKSHFTVDEEHMVSFKICDKSVKNLNNGKDFLLKTTVKLQNGETDSVSRTPDPNKKYRGIKYK